MGGMFGGKGGPSKSQIKSEQMLRQQEMAMQQNMFNQQMQAQAAQQAAAEKAQKEAFETMLNNTCYLRLFQECIFFRADRSVNRFDNNREKFQSAHQSCLHHQRSSPLLPEQQERHWTNNS